MSRYETPSAFRMALTHKLHEVASNTPWSFQQLQRQFTYDRFLERLYMLDDGWIVKGAVALLARGIGVRGSRDIDVYRAKATNEAEVDVRAAADRDLGDWFRFEVGARTTAGDESSTVRLPIVAYIGQKEWEKFHVDLAGTDLRMVGEPDEVEPVAQLGFPELEQSGYRAYPLCDHVADKVAATFQLYGDARQVSTRFRDLVDLVAISRGASVDAKHQLRALRSEAERRGIDLPKAFDAPDPALWETGYASEARKSLLTDAQTLDEALAIVRPFVNPLLQGTALGRWGPKAGRWIGSPAETAAGD